MEPINVILVGAGGYGEFYLDALLSEGEARGLRLAGVIDPYLEGCRRLAELQELGVPLFNRLEDFFRLHRCDLTILSSPIHLHCEQTCLALAYGSHVLCEKPLCARLDHVEQMLAAEQASGKTVTVGYQWSFSDAIQRLKGDALAGRFGHPQRLRTLAIAPRTEAYYQRNRWAGRKHTAEGEPIFDSPVNNATAHYLHNMLYVLGPTVSESSHPVKVEAELWRANAIENYDTAALRIQDQKGTELLFYTSHAVQMGQRFVFSYEFERAAIEYESTRGHVLARLSGGEIIDYGSPGAEPRQKLWDAAASARTGRAPVCGIAAASAHARCVLLTQEVPQGIRDFPSAAINIDQSNPPALRYVKGLAEALERCYETGKLFSEMRGLAL